MIKTIITTTLAMTILSFLLTACDNGSKDTKNIKVPKATTHLVGKADKAKTQIPIRAKPAAGKLPFSPKEAFKAFTVMDGELTALIDRSDLFTNNFIKLIKYRRSLIRRYLRIFNLYATKKPIEMPGVAKPVGKIRPIDENEIFVITLLYGKLLQEPMPKSLGSFSYKVVWKDTKGSRIYFETQEEENQLNTSLSYIAVNDQRRRIRKYLDALVDGTMGVLSFIPGGTLAENTYVLVTGRSIRGKEVSTTTRVLSLAGIGLELAPVAGGVLKAHWVKMGKKAHHPLLRELNDVDSKLRQQLRGAEKPGTKRWQVRVVKEDIMTRWIADYDRVMGMKSRALSTSKSSVNKHGHPQPARGIDSYAISKTPTSKSLGVVREFKRLRSFPGWVRSKLSLGNKKVNIPGIHSKNVNCDQASWSWIVDRGIKSHQYALKKGLTEEARSARDLLSRFVNGKVKRQVIVMTDDALIHTSREVTLGRILREATNPKTGKSVSIDELKKAATNYLADTSP